MSKACSRAGKKVVSAADNAAIVRRIFDAFARKEGLALRGLFAEDAVWSVPGRGVMAGLYEGREAIFRFLAKLPKETGGTYGSELIDVLASDDRAAALYRARGARDGRTLELDQVLLFRIDEGLVRHVLALPSDPDAFETFWA
jgi:ketosteroid isomerase-like protein